MGTRTWWETTKVKGSELVDKFCDLVREGNVRRIVIQQGDRSIAEFPLTAGLVGVVFAPALAAVGAIAALVTDCSIVVQREERVAEKDAAPEPSQEPDSEEPVAESVGAESEVED